MESSRAPPFPSDPALAPFSSSSSETARLEKRVLDLETRVAQLESLVANLVRSLTLGLAQ